MLCTSSIVAPSGKIRALDQLPSGVNAVNYPTNMVSSRMFGAFYLKTSIFFNCEYIFVISFCSGKTSLLGQRSNLMAGRRICVAFCVAKLAIV